MGITYGGKLKLEKILANITFIDDRADVDSQYFIKSDETKNVDVSITSTRTALSGFNIRKSDANKPVVTRLPSNKLKSLVSKTIQDRLIPNDLKIIDLDYSGVINGIKTKSFMYIPSLKIDGRDVVQKVQNYEVTFNLPVTAKKIVSSSRPVTVTKKAGEGMIGKVILNNVYPTPIYIRWTELDYDVQITKSAAKRAHNGIAITIKVKNNSSIPVNNLLLEDNYSFEDIIPLNPSECFKTKILNEKDPRILYQNNISLGANEQKTLTYQIRSRRTKLSIPSTIGAVKKSIIADSGAIGIFNFPIEFSLMDTAFVLPSGWSFDYLHDGDHHLNEHGMWCDGLNYNNYSKELSWNTGCIYADKNFDDDYRWSTNHQVFWFSPGFTYHKATPWLAKTGPVTIHSDSFMHPSLKNFNKCLVLLRGWRFDFSSDDHHINKMSIKISTTSFDRSKGEVKWNTQVTYADKNFDDNYRYLYYLTIFAFNGSYVEKTYNGLDNGGTAIHMGNETINTLKNFSNGMVIPIGWEFDFKSPDHHINENDFKVQNVQYDKATGKFTWTTHINYSDKNHDDDYYWKYYVILLATNDGQSRDYYQGPFNDDGGLDSKAYTQNLNTLFVPITWTNKKMDGTETGVDCGGDSPARNMFPCKNAVNPGDGASSGLFSLKNQADQELINGFGMFALIEYAESKNENFETYYADTLPEKPDRYVEAVAWYVDKHMSYVSDSWWENLTGDAQSAKETLLESSDKGPGAFNGDCEDHAILRAALLRALGFDFNCIFCADHHNSEDQGDKQECSTEKKNSGGHTYNIVIYQGKYRIMDYGVMQPRYWANKSCWDQHATTNIWNDHYGKHWDRKNKSPLGYPLVNYPGNPCCPSPNWDWRTYYYDITP